MSQRCLPPAGAPVVAAYCGAAARVVGVCHDRQGTGLGQGGREGAVSMLRRCMVRPVKLLALGLGLMPAGKFMTFSPGVGGFWNQVCDTIAVLATGWFVYRLVDVLEFYLVRWTSKTETALADQRVPLVRKPFRVSVVVVAGLPVA